jgi:energy-coupling factor transporter transmembrane protein EcfT
VNGKQFLQLLARLPARVWLQAILVLIAFVVLAVLGFALLAGMAAVLVLMVLGFKAKAWLRRLFAGRPPAPRNAPKVIDVQYEIVDHKDDERR